MTVEPRPHVCFGVPQVLPHLRSAWTLALVPPGVQRLDGNTKNLGYFSRCQQATHDGALPTVPCAFRPMPMMWMALPAGRTAGPRQRCARGRSTNAQTDARFLT